MTLIEDTVRIEDQLGAVPLRVTNPERIPAKRYYDKHFFELEREKVWPHVWQMAARLEEIPNLGDYVEYQILDKSVIIVNTKSGIKAFHNACRHRGVRLASGSGNCRTKGFICPFHGWRWNSEGENTFVFAKHIFSEEALDKAELNLVPCRLETWGGSAFINFDNNAPPLLESLGPVAERLSARHIEKLKMEWWVQTVLPTNWKLAMEAFMEGYHTMKTHPQLHVVIPPEVTAYGNDTSIMQTMPANSTEELMERTLVYMERLSTGMAGMIHADEVAIAHDIKDMPLPQDVPTAAGMFFDKLREEITLRGRARGMDVPDLNELEKRTDFSAVEFIFPHYFLLPLYSAMSSYRIRPLTEETCLFEIWSLAFLPDDPSREPVSPKMLPFDSKEFPEIPQQDYSNLPLQQLGLHADGFEEMRLSRSVEGLISNYQRLLDGYLAGVDAEKLCIAGTIVNGAYDVPIKDIGF